MASAAQLLEALQSTDNTVRSQAEVSKYNKLLNSAQL